MKTLRTCFIALCCILDCSSMLAADGFSASPDPFILTAIPANNGAINNNTKVTSLRSLQALNPMVRNLVIVAAGQSNITNAAPSAYTPTNGSKIDNFNIYDGGSYAAADPQLGCTNTSIGHPIFRLADNLITANLFDRVVIVPIGVGGTSVAEWESGTESTRIGVAFARLSSRGLVAGTNVTVIVVWGQGETDTQIGTSQGAYTASMNNVISQSRTAGFTGLWFVAKQTFLQGVVSAPIQAAQVAVVNHGANVWGGPDADAMINNTCSGVACRQGDNIHFSDAGSASYAAGFQAALHAYGAPF